MITDYYHTIDLYTKASTPNGRGGFTYAWSKSSDFQGLINQASSREIEAAAKLDIEADYKLYCGVGVSLDNEKLLKYNNNFYRIVSEPKNTVERDHHYKTLLKRTSAD